MRRLRGNEIALISQDPMSVTDPMRAVGSRCSARRTGFTSAARTGPPLGAPSRSSE